MLEAKRVVRNLGYNLFTLPLLLMLTLGIGSLYWPAFQLHWLLYLVVLPSMLIPLLPPRDMKHSLPSAGVSIAVCCYFGFALISLAYIFSISSTLSNGLDAGRWLIVFCILMVWSGDSAAYLVGSSIGRRRIAPVVSPGKTVEGTLANLVGNFLFAYVASITFLPELELLHVAALSVMFWLLGFYGDLIESSWKRGSGIKDSSHLLPGHGGIMDRVDSMFLTLPLFYFFMTHLVLQ